jgi:hypothetical protein
VVLGLIAVGVLGGVLVWSAGARVGRAAQRAVQQITRTGRVAGAAVLVAGVIALAQWVVISHTTRWSLAGFALVFGLPALLAGVTVARMVVVTAIIRGGFSRTSGSRRAGVRW